MKIAKKAQGPMGPQGDMGKTGPDGIRGAVPLHLTCQDVHQFASYTQGIGGQDECLLLLQEGDKVSLHLFMSFPNTHNNPKKGS